MADKNMEAQISVEFEEATSRQSLNSGETINTLWSKVKRWLSDLKAVAFSGSYNDLSDAPTSLPANGGNADTVNNHTVESDVPANAVFTDTTNSDVTIVGNPVVMDNLQGGVPFSEMVVSGKNLIDIAQAKALTGNDTNGFFLLDSSASRSIIQKLQPNTTYHIKKYDSGNRFRIVMFDNEPTNIASTTAKQLFYNADGSISDYTLSTGEDYLWMALTTHYNASGNADEAVEPIVQLELGSTHTSYEPPITGRELTVRVSGKNLFDGNLIIGMIQTSTGIMTGGSQYLSTPNYISVNGDCTYSLSNFENKQFDAVVFYDSNKSYISATPLNRVEPLISHFTTPKNCKYIRWRYYFDNGASIDMLSEIQLELGDTATAYEPYHGSTTTITPDSNPYIIPNDIRQQDGLNVVSVSAGEISVTGVRKNAAIEKLYNNLKTVCFSGSYNDLSDKPKIPNVDSELSETSENPVQNKVINSALTAIGQTLTEKTNEMFNAIHFNAPLDVKSNISGVNAIKHSLKYERGMIRGDGTTASFPDIINSYIEYDLADASNRGLMSSAHYSFIEKYRKIRDSSASYTFTSLQSYITVGNCNGDCKNGLVVLSGWFTSTGNAQNPSIISGSFPSAESSFVCGIIVNIDSPNTNTRLLVRHESDGSSSLQCGGDLTPGKYFFLGVYTAERCTYNLPYTL